MLDNGSFSIGWYQQCCSTAFTSLCRVYLICNIWYPPCHLQRLSCMGSHAHRVTAPGYLPRVIGRIEFMYWSTACIYLNRSTGLFWSNIELVRWSQWWWYYKEMLKWSYILDLQTNENIPLMYYIYIQTFESFGTCIWIWILLRFYRGSTTAWVERWLMLNARVYGVL